jgi:hypothetical protein
MKATAPSTTRRAALVRGLTFVVGPALATPSARAGKAAKEDFMYQDKPKGKASCASCRLFQADAPALGSCAIVDGPISPSGWCMAYSARA